MSAPTALLVQRQRLAKSCFHADARRLEHPTAAPKARIDAASILGRTLADMKVLH
jgi:hypothetical protein